MAPYKAVLSTLALLVTGLAHGQAVIISHPKVSTVGVNSDSYTMVEGRQGDVYGTYIDLNGQLFVTICKTNCQKPEGWQWVKLAKDEVSENVARIQVDAKGGLHLLQLLGSTYSPLAAKYWSCAADCAKPGSWKSTQLKHSQGPTEFNSSDYMLNHDWFMLDNQGRPRFMIANGNAMFGGSDAGFGERVVYAACDQNCHTTSNNDPGKPSQLWLYSCAQNCTSPASWKKVNLSQHSAFPRNTHDSGAEPAIKIFGKK